MGSSVCIPVLAKVGYFNVSCSYSGVDKHIDAMGFKVIVDNS